VIPLIKRKAVRDIKEGRELASEAAAHDPMAVHKTVDSEAGQQQAPIHANNATVHQGPTGAANNFSADAEKEEGKTGLALYLGKAKTQLAKGTNYDIHAVVETDPIVAALHARAEKFDPRIEVVFSYLQVFSAIAVIFAHGAGEVGYMAGPLGQIYNIVKTGKVSDKSFEPVMWVLVISAFSLVFGLATYGYNVMQAMGTMMCKLSPSRGFAAELATSMVIMIAAQYGLPTSSSQCITGGILGKPFHCVCSLHCCTYRYSLLSVCDMHTAVGKQLITKFLHHHHEHVQAVVTTYIANTSLLPILLSLRCASRCWPS
jgi:phosphate/sulfate permease